MGKYGRANVQHRGHKSIRATKVKAHQDDKSKLNEAQLFLAVENDHADIIAKDARRFHRELLKQYLSVTDFRMQHYKRLVTAIQMLLIRTSSATIINYRTHCRIEPAVSTVVDDSGVSSSYEKHLNCGDQSLIVLHSKIRDREILFE